MMKKNGNMYENVITFNPLIGECTHGCRNTYCSTQSFITRFAKMREMYTGELRLNENAFKPLGKGKTVFVCGQNDLFQNGVKFEWIDRIIAQCLKYPANTYYLQTKNTGRMYEYFNPCTLPKNFYLGTTIETDITEITNEFSGGNEPWFRSDFLAMIDHPNKYITVEPIMRFNLENMVNMIRKVNPVMVYIGANSYKKINLPEPTKAETVQLIIELEKFTTVIIKDNLRRIIQ